MREKSNENVQNEVDNDKLITDNKEKKEDDWIAPKDMPIDYFCNKIQQRRGKKERRNSNRHEVVKGNDDDEKHEGKKRIRKRNQQKH